MDFLSKKSPRCQKQIEEALKKQSNRFGNIIDELLTKKQTLEKENEQLQKQIEKNHTNRGGGKKQKNKTKKQKRTKKQRKTKSKSKK